MVADELRRLLADLPDDLAGALFERLQRRLDESLAAITLTIPPAVQEPHRQAP